MALRLLPAISLGTVEVHGKASSTTSITSRAWASRRLVLAVTDFKAKDLLTALQIWISPVVENMPQNTQDGTAYHGYWAQDIYAVNTNFGSAAGLVSLSSALHSRGMVRADDNVIVDTSMLTVSSTSWST